MGVTNTFEIFEGRIGGGKSYNAVLRIIDRLRLGGIVATNIELNRPAVEDLIRNRFKVIPRLDDQLFELKEDQIEHFERHIPLGNGSGLNPLIVIDEFHLWFNSRDFSKNHTQSRGTLTFITQARKLHVDLLLISQSALNVDKQFVRMLHGIWRFRDLEKWILPGLGFRMPFSKKYILAVNYDQDGRTITQRQWVKKDTDIFKCYETTALLRPIADLSAMVKDSLTLEAVKPKPFKQRRPYLFKFLIGFLVAFTLVILKFLSIVYMAKFFIIIGLIVGLIGAFFFVRKMVNFKSDMAKMESKYSGKDQIFAEDDPNQKSMADRLSPTNQPTEPEVTFSFKENDAVIGTPEVPNAGPEFDLEQGRGTSIGIVEEVKNGVARVKTGSQSTEFVVTDAGRDRHRHERFSGHTRRGQYVTVFGDFTEARIRTITGLPGAWAGKEVPEGVITDVTPFMITIQRKDGGKTFITDTDEETPKKTLDSDFPDNSSDDPRDFPQAKILDVPSPPDPLPVPSR